MSALSIFKAGGLALLLAWPAGAWAQEGPDLIFTLRAGAQVEPEYFGSDEFRVGPDLGFRLNYLDLGGRQIGSTEPWARPLGFGVAPSFRIVRERSAADFGELAGLEDIGTAVELGLGARYAMPDFQVFTDVRRGFGGHEAIVGEIGADVVWAATDRLTITGGPRLFLGDDAYASTYFGVTAAEAAASQFGAYEAEGGLLSAGIELGATYEFNDDWGLEGAVRFDRLQGSAADSPIVRDDGQLSVRLGVTRRVQFGF